MSDNITTESGETDTERRACLPFSGKRQQVRERGDFGEVPQPIQNVGRFIVGARRTMVNALKNDPLKIRFPGEYDAGGPG
jgi:hypothetical protein